MARGFRPRRRLVVVAVALMLVAAVAGVWLTRRSASVAQATTTTVKATTTTLSQIVTASGTIAPKVRSDLSFTWAGTVTSVAVKAGDQVSAGQTLASIDPTELQQAVDSAQASVDAADASLSATKSSSSATSNQIAAARSQVKAANAKLETAKTALAAATLQTPVTGIVAAVNIQVGNQVSGSGSGAGSGTGSGSSSGQSSSGSAGSAGSSSSASSGQIVVISTDAWVVDTSVSAADLPMVKPDLQAQIVPTGSSATVFGTVSSVGVIATTSSGVASFPVTVAVTGSPTRLYAGGTASVSIIVKEVSDALVVPTAAITTVDGKTVVTQVKNGEPLSSPVALGMVQGSLTQITTGLADGDEVLVTRSGTTPGQGGGTATRTRGTGGFGGGGTSTGGPPAGAGGQGSAPAGGGQGAPPGGGGQ